MGERGDIIRTMQRELTSRNLDRAAADRVIYHPAAAGATPIIGRVVLRGLADEHEDRHSLLVDRIDGPPHYPDIGKGAMVNHIPTDTIVQIGTRGRRPRPADRTQ